MNAGAKVNVDRAREMALVISRMRSEGLSYYEIGKALGISPGACKQRYYRYRQHGGE